jgi:hypothetical protein
MVRTKAREFALKILYNGKDITADISPDVESITYEDSASNESDSVKITVNATDEKWITTWLPDKGTTLSPEMSVSNWQEQGDSATLNCGVLFVDDLGYGEAPTTLSIGAAAKPNNTDFSEEDREFVWKNTSIKQIAQTIAGRYDLEVVLDGEDATIVKREQKGTDSSFLNDLCSDYGLTLKAYSKKLWIYDREAYKQKKAVATFGKGDITKGSFSWNDSFTGTYTRGLWTYSNQKTGVNIRVEIGTSGRTKRIDKYASSEADAERRLKAAMDNANHSATQISFSTMGRIDLSATQNIRLTGYGKLDGKYFIDKLTHTFSKSGGTVTKFKCSKISGDDEEETAAGAVVTLRSVPLYYTSTAKDPVARITGVYYLYDGELIAGRYRITNLKSRCGKLPVGKNVTGWVDAADVGGVT